MGKPIYSEDFYLALEKDGGSIQLEKESLIAPVIQMKREVSSTPPRCLPLRNEYNSKPILECNNLAVTLLLVR